MKTEFRANILVKIILVISVVWFFLLACLNAVENVLSAVQLCTEEGTPGAIALLAFLFACAAMLLAFQLVASKASISTGKGKSAAIGVTVLVFSVLIRYAFYRFVQTPQFSDYQTFHVMTQWYAAGEQRFSYYWRIWSYQAGFPLLMAPVAILVGPENIVGLQTVNILFAAVSNTLLFFMVNRAAGTKKAVSAALLYMIYPTNLNLSALYTNQHLGLMFFLAGVYIFLYWEKWRILGAVLAGIALAFGELARSEGIVIIAAMAVFAAVKTFSFGNWREGIRKAGFPAVISIAVFFAMGSAFSSLAVITGLQPYGFKNNYPLYKFAIGLNAASEGMYSREDAERFFSEDFVRVTETRDAETMEIIRERLSVGPKKLFGLGVSKVKAMWTKYKYDIHAFNHYTDEPVIKIFGKNIRGEFIVKVFRFAEGCFLLSLFAAALVACVRSFTQKEIGGLFLFSLLAFMAFSAVYLLIEVQARYRYIPMAFVFMLAFSNKPDGARKNSA